MRISALAFIWCLGVPLVGSAQAPHPLSVHDMLAMDRISDPQVSPDGTSVAFTVRVTDVEANKGLFAVDVATGRVTTLAERGTHGSPRPAGDRVVFARDTLDAPAELYSAARDGSDVRRVTDLNGATLAGAQMGAFEQFRFTGAKGDTVYGYLVKPVGWKEGARYPVAFLIHGGPQGSFGNHFHYRNPQTYAGAGYAAVMIDFHGSTGYGQAFTDAIRGDWGGAPYEDLMKGLDHALATYPFLDKNRVAALGASYGGYMINWMAGQADRFRALVCHDGNIDERTAYFATEELWFPEWEHGGPPGRIPRLREAQPHPLREELEDADARDPRRARLPRGRDPGHEHVHGAAAAGGAVEAAVLPRREPLGAQAAEQHPPA